MKFTLIRADDQLHLEVETFNLEAYRAGTGFELRPAAGGQPPPPAHIVVSFPVQHVMEYAGTEAVPFPQQGGPIYSAGRTRVVFLVPAGSAPIPFTVSGVLGALPGLPLVTDGSAGTVAEARAAAAPPAASTAELVQMALGGAGAAGAVAPPPYAVSATATTSARRTATAVALRDAAGPDGDASSDGTARGNGAAGDALLAELAVRALARRQHAEREEAPVDDDGADFAAGAAGSAPAGGAGRAPIEAPAAPAPAAPAAPPTPGTTALGFPAKLYLAVAGGATRMAHAARPVVHGGNVELWHSRLARRTTTGGLVEQPTSITAHRALILAPTTDAALSDARINSPLGTNQQTSIAIQTTQSPKKPATARRLMLSPLGAWLDASGNWPDSPVKGWRHRMVMGRDHYVQVVQRGRLYPLGHEAVLISTMERTIQTRNGRQASLVNRSTIHVVEPERDYGTPADQAGRKWPWQTVELLTEDSPSGTPQVVVTDTGSGKQAVTLNVDGQPFRFDCLAVDRGHRVTTFDLPLVFVPEGFANLAGLRSWFASTAVANAGFGALDLGGQEVALAPSTGGATPPDTTTVVARSAPLVVESGGPLGFRPVLPHVEGIVPALSRFATSGGGLPLRVSLATPYLLHGFNPAGNPGEVLFAFSGPVVDLAAGVTGGLVAPKFGITGLSRRVGLVGGDLAKAASGAFDVRQWLSGALDAFTLFGVFKLTDLIPTGLSLAANAPRMVTQTLDGLSEQELKWDVPLFGGLPNGELRIDQGLGVARLRRATGAAEAHLLIHVKASVDPATHQVRTSSVCRLTDLELILELAGQAIVTLPVPLLEFKTVDGRKPDINVVMGRIGFGGVLRFVETLASLVDVEGLSDPPAIEQIPNGVRSSFSTPIPAVAVGMFSLENIVFGAQLSLYFGGSPLELALNFATIDNPFRLTVSALGGGGYLRLLLTTRGLQELMGSLEFGAAISVNLGVARGSVSVMGGIAFFISGSEAMLTGYLRIRGEVQVLGLISIGVELTLSLSYNTFDDKVEGAAEFVMRVKVLFLRKTVRVRFEKRFAGANGDPTFAELMAPEGFEGPRPWDEYCSAFAEA